MDNIINKIKEAELVGRGGGCFPVEKKWEMVKLARGKRKYVVCNASEGEPGVTKDGYVLENFLDRVIDGMKIAIGYLNAEKGYIYINHKYYKKLGKILIKNINDLPIEIFVKPIDSGYIGGEEGALLNAIEGKRVEPRLRPPFPTTCGLWGCPTLINNVETFYDVSLVASGDYKKERFFTIGGDCLFEGVYKLSKNFTIEQALEKTKNYPKFSFFVQVGGNASGIVLNSNQLNTRIGGAGLITIYSIIKYKPKSILKNWLNFFVNESCGQCTPCREGVYRLIEIIDSSSPDWKLFFDLLCNLDDSSFCGLGNAVSVPIKTYTKNVLPEIPENKIDFPEGSKQKILDSFIK